MKIDWKRKLSTRKYRAIISCFVAAVMAFLGASESASTQITAIISAAGVIIAYILAEGLTDAAHGAGEGQDGKQE